MHPTLRYALIILIWLTISALALVIVAGIGLPIFGPEKPTPNVKREWNLRWVGARYSFNKKEGEDGCYVIFIDKDTNQFDCNDTWHSDNFCCRLADSLERNGPAPVKK